jgi:hypothetical protein
LSGLLVSDLQSAPQGTLLTDVERHIFNSDSAIWNAAAWAWSLIHNRGAHLAEPSPAVLDRLLSLWLRFDARRNMPAFALATHTGLSRSVWTPLLTNEKVQQVQHALEHSRVLDFNREAACLVAFHSRTVCSEDELAQHLGKLKRFVSLNGPRAIDAMLEQMGEVGRKYLNPKSTQSDNPLDPQ